MIQLSLLLITIVLGGLSIAGFPDRKEGVLATAVVHAGIAQPPSHYDPVGSGPDKPFVLFVQGGRTNPSGAQIAPQLTAKLVLPPKFPAEPGLPADLLQSQKLSATPSPLQSFPNTFEGRMGKLNFFSQTNAFPPSPSEPPELLLRKRAMLPPNTPPPPTPTLKQLREYLLAAPGGREMLEEARRRGLRVSRLSPDDDSWSFSLAPLLIPPEAQAAEGFKAVFTPKEPKNSALTFTGIWLFDPFKPVLDAGIHVGGPQGKALAAFNVNVPREGMYYVTVSAFMTNVKATLVKAGTIIRQWDYGPNAHIYDHWGYVHLAPGSHTFYFYVDRGTAEFIEVSVQEDV